MKRLYKGAYSTSFALTHQQVRSSKKKFDLRQEEAKKEEQRSRRQEVKDKLVFGLYLSHTCEVLSFCSYKGGRNCRSGLQKSELQYKVAKREKTLLTLGGSVVLKRKVS